MGSRRKSARAWQYAVMAAVHTIRPSHAVPALLRIPKCLICFLDLLKLGCCIRISLHKCKQCMPESTAIQSACSHMHHACMPVCWQIRSNRTATKQPYLIRVWVELLGFLVVCLLDVLLRCFLPYLEDLIVISRKRSCAIEAVDSSWAHTSATSRPRTLTYLLIR